MSEQDQTREIIEALVACANENVRLQATSPLAEMATQWLKSPPSPAAKASMLPRTALSDEDKARRRATLGSSEIAAVAGVNPYATMHNVWLSKVHGIEFEGNEQTVLGNLLEPTIFAIYAERYNRVLRKGGYMVGPEPWMAATPDAHIEGGGLVEAKLVGLRSIWMWGPGNSDDHESDEVPLHYLCQAQWQMAVTGESFVDVSALMGTEFRSYTIRANPGVQAKLIAHGRDFWERYVLTGTAPPVDGSEGSREMLKRLYPRSGGDYLQATPKLEALAADLRDARAAFEAAQIEKARCENVLKSELGAAPGVLGDGWKIRYSTTRAGSRPFVFDDDKAEKGRAA
jgi:putative phage-type endonuclease